MSIKRELYLEKKQEQRQQREEQQRELHTPDPVRPSLFDAVEVEDLYQQHAADVIKSGVETVFLLTNNKAGVNEGTCFGEGSLTLVKCPLETFLYPFAVPEDVEDVIAHVLEHVKSRREPGTRLIDIVGGRFESEPDAFECAWESLTLREVA